MTDDMEVAKREEIKSKYDEVNSWRKVAEDYPEVSHTTIRDFVYGKPAGSKTRKALGLPMYKPAPVCTCGEIHTKKTCPQERSKSSKDLLIVSVSLVKEPELYEMIAGIAEGSQISISETLRVILREYQEKESYE